MLTKQCPAVRVQPIRYARVSILVRRVAYFILPIVIWLGSISAAWAQESPVHDAQRSSVLQPLSIKPVDSVPGTKLRINPHDTRRQKIDSVANRLAHAVDTARQKSAATIDSLQRELNSRLDSLKEKANRSVSNARSSIAEEKDGLMKPVADLESKADNKLSLIQKEGSQVANITGTDTGIPEGLNQLKIPSTELPTAGVPGIKADVPSLPGSIPQLPDATNGLGDLSQLQEKLPEATNGLGDPSQLKEKLPDMSQPLGDIQKNAAEISSAATEGVDQLDNVEATLEDKVKNTDQVKVIEKEIASANGITDMPVDISNPDELKKTITTKIRTKAINHFAGKEKVLQNAIGQLDKLKAKYPHLATVKDNLPRKMKNPMHGKTFIERVVPGIDFQIQRTDVYVIDYNPNIAYRFTGRFRAGAGWNERFIIDHFKPSVSQRVFGPRVFSEYKVFKGFSARVDIEAINMKIPPPSGNVIPDLHTRAYAWGVLVGIKKEYQFIKRVKGNFQVMYHLYEDKGYSPYLQRLNVRFGFSIYPKKKSHQTSTPQKGQ